MTLTGLVALVVGVGIPARKSAQEKPPQPDPRDIKIAELEDRLRHAEAQIEALQAANKGLRERETTLERLISQERAVRLYLQGQLQPLPPNPFLQANQRGANLICNCTPGRGEVLNRQMYEEAFFPHCGRKE